LQPVSPSAISPASLAIGNLVLEGPNELRDLNFSPECEVAHTSPRKYCADWLGSVSAVSRSLSHLWRDLSAQPEVPIMRSHHAIAVVAAILIALGVKLLFFSAPAAEADIHAVKSDSMNVLQMHIDHPNMKNLPVQDVKDPI
jgi:hypothetical protein